MSITTVYTPEFHEANKELLIYGHYNLIAETLKIPISTAKVLKQRCRKIYGYTPPPSLTPAEREARQVVARHNYWLRTREARNAAHRAYRKEHPARPREPAWDKDVRQRNYDHEPRESKVYPPITKADELDADIRALAQFTPDFIKKLLLDNPTIINSTLYREKQASLPEIQKPEVFVRVRSLISKL